MDFTEKRRVENPELKANPISKFLFLWITPLLRKGTKQTLSIDDLYDRLPEDDASTLGDKMQRLWKQELKRAKAQGRTPSFFRTCMLFFGPKFFWFTFFIFFNEMVLKLSQPFILRNLIRSFSSVDTTGNGSLDIQTQQYLYTTALILVTFFYAINIHHIYLGLIHLAMQGCIACRSIIYRKIFRLSKTVQSEKVSIGKLVNLIASDSNRFDGCFFHVNMLIIGPAQLIVLSYFLYMELGFSCFVGIGIIAGVLIPFQGVVGRLTVRFRSQVAARTDERGRMVNQIIMGIKIIKMYAWEAPFSAVIHKLRKFEILPVRKSAYLRGTFQSINAVAKNTIPFCTFVLYVSFGNSLTADTAYFTIVVYSILIPAMAQKIPVAAAATAELLVSIRRIQEFLLLEELQTQGRESNQLFPIMSFTGLQNGNICDKLSSTWSGVPHVVLNRVSANWNSDRLTLQNISMNLTGNKLIIVCGKVGCGKSSLLNLIISELSIHSGTMNISGKLSYASQDCWIFGSTIRQNILFGSLYDRNRFESIVRVCGLEDDLQQFTNRDQTIVGDRGVDLSGGQKARVSLARALYRKADIYLLDDPLSAVDVRVGRHIFEQCIQNHLAGSLRILVTHQLQYLPQADHIIVFDENGKIAAQGNYQDLVSQKVDFICTMLNDDENVDDAGDVGDDMDSSSVLSSDDSSKSTIIVPTADAEKVQNNNNNGNKSREETMMSGSVSWKTYFTYITSGNSKIELVFVIFFFIASQTVISFTDKWLSLWTNEVSQRSLNHTDPTNNYEAKHSEQTYITVYSACVGSVLILVSMKAILYFHYVMSISVRLHDRMFSGLVKAPVHFFDTNPSGRIINRFTKDLNCVDG